MLRVWFIHVNGSSVFLKVTVMLSKHCYSYCSCAVLNFHLW